VHPAMFSRFIDSSNPHVVSISSCDDQEIVLTSNQQVLPPALVVATGSERDRGNSGPGQLMIHAVTLQLVWHSSPSVATACRLLQGCAQHRAWDPRRGQQDP